MKTVRKDNETIAKSCWQKPNHTETSNWKIAVIFGVDFL